ncbi:MAG TPA: outer membrane protein assembly factor BamE [Stellaceae bacterium]|nr:outer membrane protein assembly factor BamE [Stellaceae bacterium]
MNRRVFYRLPWRQAFAAAALALAGCTNPVDLHGNLPEADKVAQIKPGSTDKATVTQLLGSPSSVAAFDSNTWYYISQKTRILVLNPPEILDQQVVAIAFDDNGVVRDVEHRTMADGAAIAPNPNATPAPGREFTFLEQLIGNFGRFTGKDKGSGGSASGH